jgi:hypothetical protein
VYFRQRHGARFFATGSAARTALAALVAAAALVAVAAPAAAQGIFDTLFRRWSPPNAYADPNASWNPFGWRTPEAARPETGGATAYCVRLCDGRFFPVQQHAGLSAAQACSSFCPASQTKIYHGGSIEQAVGADGRRYSELSTAFAFRQKIVESCTCNGRDAFGLVNTAVAEDPTLRPGDIVATNSGLMAYVGNGRQAFTPIQSYSGVSAELRRKLTETRIAPAEPAAPAPLATPTKPADVRNARNKRAQAER